MSPRLPGPRLLSARPRPLLGGWFLLVLFLSACATGVPLGGRMMGSNYRYRALTPPLSPKERVAPAAEPGLESATVYVVDFLEPGAVRTRPVPIKKAEFQQAFLRLSHDVRLKEKTPRQAAHELLSLLGKPPEAARVGARGDWKLEASGGQGYTLVPVNQEGPVFLTPQAQQTLMEEYLRMLTF